MHIHYMYTNKHTQYHSVPPPFLLGRVEPPSKFSKRGEGADRISVFEVVARKEGVTLFRGEVTVFT